MKYFVFVFIFLGLSSVYSQLSKADRYFEDFKYFNAVKLYEKAAKELKEPDAELYIKIAECYRKMSDFQESEIWYSKAASIYNSPYPDFYLNYGSVLKNNRKYDEAKKIFKKYHRILPNDPRGMLYVKSCDSVAQWDKEKPFATSKNEAWLNTSVSDFGPAFYKNGVVFTSARRSNYSENYIYGWTGNYYLDLFYAVIPKSDEEIKVFGGDILNSDYHDGPAAFNKDFSKVYFTRTIRSISEPVNDQPKVNFLKIYSADFHDGKWKAPEPFFMNNDSFSIGHPCFSIDGMKMYFVSDMPGGYGETDLYVCSWEENKWSAPKNMGPNFNTFGREMFPNVDANNNLYFASDGWVGYGGLDIFISQYKMGKYGYPVNLRAPINSSADDFSFIIAQDKRSGYFSSNRVDGRGEDDIYSFYIDNQRLFTGLLNRIPDTAKAKLPDDKDVLQLFVSSLNEPRVKLNVKVMNPETFASIDSASVWIYSKERDELKEVLVGKEGLMISVPKGQNISFKAYKDQYLLGCNSVATDELKIAEPNPININLIPFEVSKGSLVAHINYDLDKAAINPESQKKLEHVISFINNNSAMIVEVGSHADARGGDEYNKVLSRRRSESIVSYLVTKGVDKNRIKAAWYGESQLLNKCTNHSECSEEEHFENRRTEFKIVGISSAASQLPGLEEIRNKLTHASFLTECQDIDLK